MPCRIETEPARTELDEFGRVVRRGGGTTFWCGSFEGEPGCADCYGFGDYLCDYPVGEGKTCDRAMCENHRRNIGPELDYCAAHYVEWERFRDSGGVLERLANVVPFSAEKYPRKTP